MSEWEWVYVPREWIFAVYLLVLLFNWLRDCAGIDTADHGSRIGNGYGVLGRLERDTSLRGHFWKIIQWYE